MRLHTSVWAVILLTAVFAATVAAQDLPVRRVVVSWHEGPENIYEVKPDGSLGRRLTNAPDGRGAWVPDFSPDCREIVFASNMEDSGGANIYVMHADGSNVRRLTHPERDRPGVTAPANAAGRPGCRCRPLRGGPSR
jgi:tricorn protease-like protein